MTTVLYSETMNSARVHECSSHILLVCADVSPVDIAKDYTPFEFATCSVLLFVFAYLVCTVGLQ